MYSEYNAYSSIDFLYIPSFPEEVKEKIYSTKTIQPHYTYFLLRVNCCIFEKWADTFRFLTAGKYTARYENNLKSNKAKKVSGLKHTSHL